MLGTTWMCKSTFSTEFYSLSLNIYQVFSDENLTSESRCAIQVKYTRSQSVTVKKNVKYLILIDFCIVFL
jgi:hypothetical protein